MISKDKLKIYVGEYGPITVGIDGQLTFGYLVRYIRRLHTIPIHQVAALYAQVAEKDQPVLGRRIRFMEQTDGFFPKDPKRRVVLAKLLNIPPVLLATVGLDSLLSPEEQRGENTIIPGPVSRHIDVEEYYTALQTYWTEGYPHGLESAVDDAMARIDRLHDTVLYVRTKQKQEIIRLLCGFQIQLAEIAKAQRCYQAAKSYLANALLLAREKACTDLLPIVLYRREVLFDDLGDQEQALLTLEQIKQDKHKWNIPAQLEGAALSMAGFARARAARNETDKKNALLYLDEAENLTRNAITDNYLFFVSFDRERHLLNRAATLMRPTERKLRAPERAQECLLTAEQERKVSGEHISSCRQQDTDLIQAQIYYDRGFDPIAAATAERVVNALDTTGQYKYLKPVTELFQGIKARHPYDDFTVSLELALMKVQNPHLFH
ncbi:hypothetical protein EPA93_18205 [Ktedonosporobacter rubrisoli]|uniref:Uncharacterized protein n=1 Tax=Ktedonosporobacter rubrisoli TaxID=2509675 RepID=A0A4P6JRI9_KTERU|nr:hypothetical protein [Ktedonosporobacter rubrisoli]QBD77822.1 hypothetical protein EPA93_18205 [Ktedonosporobacter rubrisoli]